MNRLEYPITRCSLTLAKAISQFVKGSYKNIIDNYKYIA